MPSHAESIPVILVALTLGGCVTTGYECENLGISRIEAPAQAVRGQAVAVTLRWSKAAPWGEPQARARVDDAARVVTFETIACETIMPLNPRTYPQGVVMDAALPSSFTPGATGTYTLVSRGATATVEVQEPTTPASSSSASPSPASAPGSP